MKYRWQIAPSQPELAATLAAQLRLSPLLAQCLLNRGLADPSPIHDFLHPRLRNLQDPFRLEDMDKAVERLMQAREQREPVVIFGDYDVDGVTSTVLLVEVLRELGWQVAWYLPHRVDEGYGLSREAAENCLKKHPAKLLLAVDCGSTAVEPIIALRAAGVEVIVLDHHQGTDPLPPAVALVNPHARPQSNGTPRDFGELCSVGLAFKLAHAVVKRGRELGLPGAEAFDLRPLLDLVALGTIADLVPLVGENRILVSTGLERLNATARPGLLALMEVAETPSPLGTYEVGFQLGPRLNAAGRLETAEEAVHLLLAPDRKAAMPIATSLDARNRERQRIERNIVEEVAEVVRARFRPEQDYVIVEGRADWHVGVVGIVASRVLQQFYRPTIIAGGDGTLFRGSGRSIVGLDLAAALRECGDLLVRHGGHALAAGVSFEPAQLDAFRSRLNEVAHRLLKPADLEAPLRLDAAVDLSQLSFESMAGFDQLRPVGLGNPGVQLCSPGVTLRGTPLRMGNERQHLKFRVADRRTEFEAVWWNAGNDALPRGAFDLAFAPQVNDYRGRRSIQLKVLDWRPGS